MTTPEIHICSNVVCLKIWDENCKLIAETPNINIIPRLTYWELYGLFEALPLVFAPHHFAPANLNPKQMEELKAFTGRTMIPWPEITRLTPYDQHGYNYELNYPFPPVSSENIKRMLQHVPDPDPETEKEEPAKDITPPSEQLDLSEPPPTERALPDEPELFVDYQERFIKDSLNKSHLIFAPPGTGKTHALIQRVSHIIKNANFEDPSSEVVVLSFSRAAVREVRKRIADAVCDGADGDFEYITVRTFDSFATNTLLLDLDYEHLSSGQSAGSESSFDKRIQQFNGGLDTGYLKKGIERIDKIRFLFVDEVQDLCAVRAEMVKLLIARVLGNGHSVALFGDPAQGIYDWQTKETGGITSRQFLTGVEHDFGNQLQKIWFKKYYRYENDSMLAFARAVAQAVGDGNKPQTIKLQKLTEENCRKINSTDIKNLLSELGSLAVLTRSNLESWQLADYCRSSNIPFEIHRGAGGRRWPEWLGRLMHGFKQDKMSDAKFEQRWNSLIGKSCGIDSNQAWNLLKSEGVIQNRTIDLSLVNRRILTEEVPDNWIAKEKSNPSLLISTIHKSKGMEFPHVLVLEASPDSLMKSDEEARVFYVAVTRAKKKLLILKREKSVFPRRNKLKHGIYRFVSLDARGAYMDEQQWDLFSITEDCAGVPISNELMQRRQQAFWDIWIDKNRSLKIPFLQLKKGAPYWLTLLSEGEILPLMKNGNGVDKDLSWIKRITQEKMKKQFTGYSAEICGLETIALEQAEKNQERMGNACLLVRPVLTERVLLEEENG